MNKQTLSSLGAVLACMVASIAWGQNLPETDFTPKNPDMVDQRGVDLARRTLSVGHSISIGNPAKGGLSYSTSYCGGQWCNYRSVMAFVRVDALTDPDTGSFQEVWALYFGGKSEQMYWDGTGYVGEAGSRMSVCPAGACAPSATLSDGTVLTFSPTPMWVSETGTIFTLTSAVKPNGERLYYYYVPGTFSIQAITNNYGYQLRFGLGGPVNYQTWQNPSYVTLFNMAVDPCDPTAASCTFSRTWPRLSYEYTGGGVSGNISAITETGGARTVYTYGAASQQIEYINGPGNRDTSITYQNCGYLPPHGSCNAGNQNIGGYRVQTVTKGGRTWTYSWDSSLVGPNPEHGVRVTSAVGSVGYRSAVSTYAGFFEIYLPVDRLISVKDELSRTTRLEIGGQLNPLLVKVTYPEGNGTQYFYDQRANLVQIRNFAKAGYGLADQNTYIERAESGGTTQCIQPAICNKPVRVRDPRGYVTRYTWNATTGQLSSFERGLEGPSSSLTCALGFDQCPLVNFGYTNLSAYYFNGASQLVPGQAISVLTSSSQCENTASCGASDQVITALGYGSAGVANNLLVRTTAVGKGGATRTTSYAYDAVGNRVEIDGPRTDVYDITRFGWDLDRRPTDEVFADGSATRRAYSSEGYLASSSRGTSSALGQFTPYETTVNEYDGAGNLTKTASPAGVTQKSYDAAGRLSCTVQRMNPSVYGSLPSDACALSTPGVNGSDRITRNLYDAAGQVTTIQRAYNTALVQNYATYGYTLNGKHDWVQDANGNRSDYNYDGFDRLGQFNLPSATLGANTHNPNDYELYTYDANNNRDTQRLRSGETLRFTFDAINRETRRYDLPNAAALNSYTGYDLMSRMRWTGDVNVAAQRVENTYDAWNGIKSERTYAQTLTYNLDEAGNRTRLMWSDGNYVDYTYDAMNRMYQVRENGATSAPGLLAYYTYDVLGRRSTLVRGNGATTTTAYDGASRLSGLSQDLATSTHDLTLGFTYNAASQILQRTLSNDAYQSVAAAQSKPYVPDGLNRYTSVGGVQFLYDARGNLRNNGSRSFTYDLENHLVRVDAAAGSPTQLTLSYDPRGRLWQTAGSTTIQFLYAGDRLVAELNGSGAITRRYVHGASVDEPLVWYEGATISSSTRQWLHGNHQGSIIGVSGSSGALVGSPYSYLAYGEPDVTHGWSGSRFRYTGQIAIPEVELYHYKSRVYDPAIGRFLQTDSIGYKDDLNLYAYVGNDPLNRTDPTGRTWRDFWRALATAIMHWTSEDPPPPPPQDPVPYERKLNDKPSTPGSGPKPDPKPDPEADPETDSKQDPKPDPKSDPESKPKESRWAVPPMSTKKKVAIGGASVVVGGIAVCIVLEPCGAIVGTVAVVGGGVAVAAQ